ncbi:endonuclease/exonuclease/phosphatase family protein [Tropicibacter oceani]|uniref:Endonuclease/exonuclease/phosphatase family protein n=1 Tax=Tropicibacter oceani TaxID=3058420 RepID=A0ABY8QE97_9RHOB|nr:endonuclease/exonuclease/phosphatase family protein [Tropicibacter oceani]WGW02947.1 endonuclease/exonuclease/phosphatase family protein [Tropicibacter oceani]
MSVRRWAMRIASLNMQNLRLLTEGGAHLYGARDRDDIEDPALDAEDRRLSAELLARTGADVIALQEVFDQQSLDFFHDHWLARICAPYPYRVCLPGNDGRGLDVAVMARRPWDTVISHAALMPGDLGLAVPEGGDPAMPVFRRDCLELRFGALTLFVVHFKAPYPDADRAWAVRRLEAQAATRLVQGAGALWLVVGDLNEPEGAERAVAPLEALGENLMLRVPQAQRWTYFETHDQRYDAPDGMIASPGLAARYPQVVPQVLKCGMGRETGRYHGARLVGTGVHRPHASDHAALVVEFPEL